MRKKDLRCKYIICSVQICHFGLSCKCVNATSLFMSRLNRARQKRFIARVPVRALTKFPKVHKQTFLTKIGKKVFLQKRTTKYISASSCQGALTENFEQNMAILSTCGGNAAFKPNKACLIPMEVISMGGIYLETNSIASTTLLTDEKSLS